MHGDTISPSYSHYISVCRIGEPYLTKEMKNSPVPQEKRKGSYKNQVPKGGIRVSWGICFAVETDPRLPPKSPPPAGEPEMRMIIQATKFIIRVPKRTSQS